jgi:hypothetical protein
MEGDLGYFFRRLLRRSSVLRAYVRRESLPWTAQKAFPADFRMEGPDNEKSDPWLAFMEIRNDL